MTVITDPFGPAIVLPEIQCIVASQETEAGCISINDKRREADLKELDIHLIDLAQDNYKQSSVEEDKISSSSGRIRLLGSRLSPALRKWDKSGPYIIGKQLVIESTQEQGRQKKLSSSIHTLKHYKMIEKKLCSRFNRWIC